MCTALWLTRFLYVLLHELSTMQERCHAVIVTHSVHMKHQYVYLSVINTCYSLYNYAGKLLPSRGVK